MATQDPAGGGHPLDRFLAGEPVDQARADRVGFLEAATTTTFGERKGLWDWVPFLATGREGIGWVDMYRSADAFNGGTATGEQREMLEQFLDYHARERGFGGRVGEIAGDLPTFAVEFGAGLGLAKLIGQKAMTTAAGKGLQKALTKMAQSKIGTALEHNAASRTAGKLMKAGASGVAVGIVSELPRAPWGRVMANARRLQFQRRFQLDRETAGALTIEVMAGEQSLVDVLPTAILDELIEYGSEMTGAAIPFVSKIDALHDDILAFFFSKHGVEAGRKFFGKHGIGGVFSEIGEEYLGGATRETIGALGGPEEFKGSLPDTLGQTLEMYVAFGLRGGVGTAKGIWGDGVEATRQRAREDQIRTGITEQYAKMGLEGEELERRVEFDMEALRNAKSLEEANAEQDAEQDTAITEEEIEALEGLEPEDAEEILRGKGLVPTEEESAEVVEPEEETVEPVEGAETSEELRGQEAEEVPIEEGPEAVVTEAEQDQPQIEPSERAEGGVAPAEQEPPDSGPTKPPAEAESRGPEETGVPPSAEAEEEEPDPAAPPEGATDAMLRHGDESAVGEESSVVLPTGKSIPAAYVLAEAELLTPSHDPRRGFRKNEGGDENERPYEDPTEGAASRQTVQDIAAKLDPRLLLTDSPTAVDGPPIVNRWGVVLGGNARTMAMQLVYGVGGEAAEKYRAALRKAAKRYGFTPADLDAFTNPVLVREVAAGHEGAPGELSRVLNQALTTPKTATTDAVSRGRSINPAAASSIADTLGEDTLGKALGNPIKARSLLQALVRAGAFVEADLFELTDPKGALTKAGRAVVEETLLGAVVTDVRALASLAPGHRNKLIAALPGLVLLKAAWPAFAEHLVETADALASLRQSKQRMSEALRQQTIEDESWKLNPVAVMLANALRDLGPRQFASKASEAAQAAQESSSGQGGLFEGSVPTDPWEALRGVFGQWETDLPDGGAATMGSPGPSREAMTARRAARARRSGGTALGSPGASGKTAGKPPPGGRGKTEPSTMTGVGALPAGDSRVERTHAVLRKFGILGRDDPIAIARTMEDARDAAEGIGEVDLRGRDNLYAIIIDLARRFGLGQPGVGKDKLLRKWAAGFYQTDTSAIRLRKASFISTYFHELGHHLHKVMFPRRGKRKDPETGKMTVPALPFQLSGKDFPKQWRPGLIQLGRDLYGDRKPAAGYAAEGWAEVVRFLVTDPAHLEARAPALYQDVAGTLQGKHPETWIVLQEARQRFRAWLVGSDKNPVGGFVQRGKPSRSKGRTRRDRWTMDWFDRRVRVRTALEDMGVMDKIPFHENPYWMMRRVEGHTSGDLKLAVERGTWDPADPTKARTGKSLHEIFEPVKDTLELWEDYAIARRVLEKRDQGFEVLPSDPRAEVTAGKKLEDFIAEMEALHPEFSTVHAGFQEFNKWLMTEYSVHHQLQTPEAAKLIVAKNREYIPFRYAATDDALRKAGGRTGSFVNLGTGVSWFKNSQGEPLLPPLPAFMAQLEGIIGRAHHNAASRALLTLADNPDLNDRSARWFQRIERPIEGFKAKGDQLSAEVMRQLGITESGGKLSVPGELAGMDEGELTTLIEMIENFEDATFWKPSNDVDEARGVVRILVKGKPQFYQVNGEGGDLLLWETLRGFYSPAQAEGFARIATMPAALLRAGATQNNISFGLMNVVRDVWQALTLTTTMLKNPSQISSRLLGIREAFVAGDWSALYQASGADMEGLFGAPYWNEKERKLDLAVSFDESGLLRPESRAHLKAGRVFKAALSGRIATAIGQGKPVKAAFEASLLPLAGRLNTRLERMTRLGEFIVRYRQAQSEGLSSEAEALAISGHASANITLDWTKGGRHAKVVNQYIPFFNAALLGPARIAEHLAGAAKKGPGHLLGAFARISSFMILPSVLMFLMVWDDDEYWNIDQKKRDRYWYFPTGRSDAGAKTYLRLPKPYGLATWSILAERSFASLFGIDPQTGERTGDPESFDGVIGSILNELTPTFSIAGVQPVIEVMAGAQGYDFYWDNEVVPTRDKDLPVGMRGAERSSRLSRMLGHALGYPPAKIDHLIFGLTAGAGRDMVRTVIDPMVGVIAPWTGDLGEPFRSEDLPIIRRFLDSEARGRNEAVERFYEDWEDVDAANRGLNRLEEIHGPDDRRTLAFESRHRYDLSRYKKMNRQKRRLAKLWSELRTSYRVVVDANDLDREILRIHREIVETARDPYQR